MTRTPPFASWSPTTRCCCARGSCACSTRRASRSSASLRRRRLAARRARRRSRPTSSCSTCGCRPRFRDEGVRAAIRARELHARASASCCSRSTSRWPTRRSCCRRARGGVGYLLKDRVASLDELRGCGRPHRRGWHRARPRGRRAAARSPPRPARVAHPARARGDGAHGRGAHERRDRRARSFIGTGAVEKNVTSIFQKLGLEDSGTDHRRVLAVLAWLQAG